ncbi:hypothetical protein SPRG_08792 [Saprolegnia parasitica CBS 223.65]|uniref:PH domain-containing protein n=1 Tax=Saprolegnia parasitica (strain CBS 223.65) TaxID=695850 RepID=A0A067C5Q9_SAPPC|nr:hypothetical protein SPRG_08792 [Saprolegnia parasitica CBS 223.65]KDO25848.1 hypothetical protein SPRG_08792 [Saprolegnia parasitica CBS 223.65]|eukprot:XP_012203412.1 hypothetical protein SPRG_08792 [Saprolegnia parasitica CBS 223.65]
MTYVQRASSYQPPKSSLSVCSDADSDYYAELRHTTPAMNPRLKSKVLSLEDLRATTAVDDMPSFQSGPDAIPILEESVTYDVNLRQKGVIYSGVLYRRRRGPMQHWLERWTLSHFVLTWNCLRYYSQNGEKLRGEIDLSHCSEHSIEVLPVDSVFNGRQATLWRFAVRTRTRRLIMSAMTEFEMNVWVKHLLLAMGLDASKQVAFFNRMNRADSEDVPIADFAAMDTAQASMVLDEDDGSSEHDSSRDVSFCSAGSVVLASDV